MSSTGEESEDTHTVLTAAERTLKYNQNKATYFLTASPVTQRNLAFRGFVPRHTQNELNMWETAVRKMTKYYQFCPELPRFWLLFKYHYAGFWNFHVIIPINDCTETNCHEGETLSFESNGQLLWAIFRYQGDQTSSMYLFQKKYVNNLQGQRVRIRAMMGEYGAYTLVEKQYRGCFCRCQNEVEKSEIIRNRIADADNWKPIGEFLRDSAVAYKLFKYPQYLSFPSCIKGAE